MMILTFPSHSALKLSIHCRMIHLACLSEKKIAKLIQKITFTLFVTMKRWPVGSCVIDWSISDLKGFLKIWFKSFYFTCSLRVYYGHWYRDRSFPCILPQFDEVWAHSCAPALAYSGRRDRDKLCRPCLAKYWAVYILQRVSWLSSPVHQDISSLVAQESFSSRLR